MRAAINYELLRTLLVVGTSDTFAEAARRRGVTPPAISQQVSSLEAQLGVPLFERSGRRARLTSVGADLVAVLREQLGPVEDALTAVIDNHRLVRGVVRIGAPRAFTAHWLRPRMIELLQTHPELRVHLVFDVPSRLRRELLEGALDLALLVTAVDHPSLEARPVHVEEFVAVASPAYVRAHGTPISVDDFRQQSFLVFDDDIAMLAPWWRARFGPRESLPQNFVCQVASLDELAALAEAGLGIAVLPSYLVAAPVARGTLTAFAATTGTTRRLSAAARNPISLAWRRGALETARFVAVRTRLLAR